MTKEEYRQIICRQCVNYDKECKEDICMKFFENYTNTKCNNYHLWTECISKNCNKCRKCK